MRKNTWCKVCPDKMEKTKLWILKFTDEGGVWATDIPPNQRPLLTPGLATSRCASSLGSRTASSMKTPLEVGDFVVADGKRAQIRNIFLSVTRGSLARLFYIDTAEEGTLPVHNLFPMPETLMEEPPLALPFTLDSISPKHTHPDITLRGKWAEVAMGILRNIVGSDTQEVEVHADIKPGDRIVIYHDTQDGELNFNQFLIDADIAIAQSVPATPTPPHLPSSDQLMTALESLAKFESDESQLDKPVTQVSPTSSTPVTTARHPDPLIPYQYHTVYVDSPLTTKPCVSLEQAGFPGSICKVLTRLGFQSPSLVQGCSWPLVGGDGLTIIISPPLSGKTLSYLLPLVNKREIAWSLSEGGIPHPRLIVVVPSSWCAQAVYTRAKDLVSALSANRRFRCCCAYMSQEKVVVEILNGVEVLVCTPNSLLRLVEKTVGLLDSLTHLVLDGYEQLYKNFSCELVKILGLCSRSECPPVNVVVTTTKWSQDIEAIPALIASHTHLSSSPTHFVIACPIEATIRAGVKMNVIPCQDNSPNSILQQLLNQRGCGQSIICVATMETAISISQYLKSLCWPVVTVHRADGLEDMKQLLQKETVVILVDDVIPDMLSWQQLITSDITHYELSKTKTAFTNRLALHYPAIHRGVPCSHTILLTDQWERQSGLLMMMMERTNQSPPQNLKDMAGEMKQAKEIQRNDFDLCYNLKAWGSCSDTLYCTYRHTHITTPSTFPSPQSLHLPLDGSIKVKVSHISTATRWWVSLLGHVPLHRGAEPVKSHDPNALVKMTSDLAQYFTPERQRNLLNSVPSEGNYCALKDKDGCFYRVRILKFSHPLEFMFHHKEKAKVRLIDIGEARMVDVSQLLALPHHLLASSPLVFEVFLCSVKPTDFDPNWPPQAADSMHEEYGNETVHGRVALVSGETVWLDPIERRFELTGLNVTTALTTPQRQLVKAGMAEPNPDHLINLSNNLGLPLVSVEPISIDDPHISFASFVCGSSVEVCLSAVDSPNWFYLQPMATESRVIKIEDSLNQYEDVASMSGCHRNPLPVGTVCAAQFSENKCWYRGCVLEVEGHESRIRFLDYGNVEWVPNHLVQLIHPTALELPFQACYCTFGMDDTKWGEDACTLLYEWTRELILIAKVKNISLSHDKLLYGPECATVDLYEQSTGSDREGGGTNIALRLPANRPSQAMNRQDTLPNPPSIAAKSTLQQLCLRLCSDQDRRESVAMTIKNLISNKQGLCISGCVLESVCQLIGNETTPPSVSIPILKAFCILSAFHSSVCVQLSKDPCLSFLVALVKNSSSQDVLSQTLVLLVCLLKYIDSSSVLCTESTLKLLLDAFRNHANNLHGNAQILRLLISILRHVTTSDPDLLTFSAEHGIIHLLCDWLTHAASLLPTLSTPASSIQSCIVQFAVGILEGVAKIPLCRYVVHVSESLSLDSLCSLLTKHSSVKIIHAILRLLDPLCKLPEFGARLYLSALFVNLYKVPKTTTVAVLLHSIKHHMEPVIKALNTWSFHSTNHISPLVVSGNLKTPPPLVESEEEPLIPSTSEESSVDSNSVRTTSEEEGETKPIKRPQRSVKKLEIPALHPRVLWSQRETSVLLAVQLRGCEEKDTIANFTPTTVSFRTRVWNQDYKFSIELFAPLNPEMCSLSLTGSEILLKLSKSDPVKWPRLHCGDRRLVHFSVDFNRWQDEDVGILGANNASAPSWPAPITSKSTSYVNPVLTESDLDTDDTGSESREREEEEGEENVWQDDFDMGFQ